MNAVKFAVLGYGKIGSRHAEKLMGVKGAELESVCDIVPERADAGAKAHGVPAYYSLEDLLANSKADFINVCTPTGLHFNHTMVALEAGKHVLCEKPMALRAEEAVRMVETAEKNGKLLFVVKQNRFNAPVRLVAKLLRDGKMGTPIKCAVNMFWNRNEAYYKSDPWRGTLALDGGTIYTQASHFVDLMLAFMGKPKTVFALMGTKKQPIEIEDTGVIATEFENGGFGSFNYTTCATNKNFEGSVTLIGTKGTVKIGGQYLNTIDHFEVEGMEKPELDGQDAGANDYGAYKGSMSNHDKVFATIVAKVNGVPGVEEHLVSGDAAVLSIRFMEKAIESAKAGRLVHFS